VTRRVVVSDDVPGTILRLAESDETDLIAISTRGRGAIARAATGSVADRILRDAPVSAMVTHPMVKARVIAKLAATEYQPAPV
jgi:nucleotide-binding universal stress UspA family protein